MANASLPLAKKYPVFLSADDIRGLEGLSIYMKEESGYAEIQKTKPDTIGYALNDSPAGEKPLPGTRLAVLDSEPTPAAQGYAMHKSRGMLGVCPARASPLAGTSLGTVGQDTHALPR